MADVRFGLRHGDLTTTGGVIFATGKMRFHGKEVAAEGDLATCPACKAMGELVNDAYPAFGLPGGRQLAIQGAWIFCKCANPPRAIASTDKFRVTVNRTGIAAAAPASALPSLPAPSIASVHTPPRKYAREHYDLFFHAKHEKTGKDLCHVRYRITLEDGRQFIGVTDEKGHTQKVSAGTALIAKIEIPYYDNSPTDTSSEPEPCGC